MEYRLQTDEIILHQIEGEGGAWSIWGDGENFWLPPREQNDPIRCWNKSTGETSMVGIQVPGYRPVDMSFLKIFNSGNCLIVSPECANMFLRIDIQTGRAEPFDIACAKDVAERYGYFFETAKDLYFAAYVSGQENIYFKIEKDTLAVKQVHFTLQNSDSFLKAVGSELKIPNDVVMENETNNLEEFIAMVQLLPRRREEQA
ncbi:MAG: hypothetical protein NC091_05305 [Bacteroides sp.]|nr:hypothetical protein [Bacteroides sp.]